MPHRSQPRVARHRASLRAQGLRPIQLWVPDVRSDQFRQAAHAQSLAAANAPSAAEDQAFIDALAADMLD